MWIHSNTNKGGRTKILTWNAGYLSGVSACMYNLYHHTNLNVKYFFDKARLIIEGRKERMTMIGNTQLKFTVYNHCKI